ncbi:MAG: type IV pilus assembly protein PilM [Planctomycetota bacterium]
MVGLDLGSSVVKAIELTMEGSEPVVTGFARAEIPPGGSVQEAMQQVFSEGRFKAKRVVTGVSGQSTVVRYIPMMRMSDEELRQAILFEADKYLPFDISECVMDCQPLRNTVHSAGKDGEGANSTLTVLLAACRRQELEKQAQMIKKQGLIPFAIDLDLFAVANAWELCGLPMESQSDGGAPSAIALVDVGATRSSVNVLSGGESCFSREINIGGADMTQAIVRRLGVEGFEAEAIKRAADTHEHEIALAVQPVLEELASELALSIDYVEHHEGVQVEETLLSGGGILAPGVVQYIEQATARPTRTWNPLEALRVDPSRVDVEELEAWAPSLVVAVGLASRVQTR